MQRIRQVLTGIRDADLTAEDRLQIARELAETAGLEVYADSVSLGKGLLLAMTRDGNKRLLAIGGAEQMRCSGLSGAEYRELAADGTKQMLALAARGHELSCFVREALPWTAPRVCGLDCSVGLGDRTGLATPGHIRAVCGSGCVPYLPQQSIREMTRTERSPANVMDDACWGVFQAGWREGFGSDADHLKTTQDIDNCLAVGFTMYTFDPGDHVHSEADSLSGTALTATLDSVPWKDLEISLNDYRKTYLDKSFALDGGQSLRFDEQTIGRAAVKYGGAIAHAARMYRHLAQRCGSRPFEVEVSVDETSTPTTEAEHYLVAAELKRMGVRWVGLAPRFIGEFEKGIDYKGDISAFEKSFAQHAAIARTLGPYKLSIHSGSDKFSIYPITARLAQRRVHLKTAGTSYLEALRVVARCKPDLFRRILDFAFERFDEDKATYHISARKEVIPRPKALSDAQLESVLDGNDGRQLLHVTFGSVLTRKQDDGTYRFRNELMDVLNAHEEEHYAVLTKHLGRHVQPFAAARR